MSPSVHCKYCSLHISEGSQGRNPEAETEAESTEGSCSLVCSSWLTQQAGPSHNHKSVPYRLAYSPTLWRHFLSWGSLLSDDSSTGQVGLKLASTSAKDKYHPYFYTVHSRLPPWQGPHAAFMLLHDTEVHQPPYRLPENTLLILELGDLK